MSMHLSDTATLRGAFVCELRRADGALIERIEEANLIVNGAKDQLARLVGGAGANRHITHIGFGVGTSAASPNNTGLTGAYWKPITSVSYPATGQAAFAWSLSTAEANGLAITEFGPALRRRHPVRAQGAQPDPQERRPLAHRQLDHHLLRRPHGERKRNPGVGIRHLPD